MNTRTNWEKLVRIALLTIGVVVFFAGAFSQPASAARQEPTVIHGGVVNGKAVSLPKPAYPEQARAARVSGSVEVQVTIDEAGNVIAAEAVSGDFLLRDAAVAAAREAKFPPTRLNGVPVKVTGTIIYNFRADADSDASPPPGPVGPTDPDPQAGLTADHPMPGAGSPRLGTLTPDSLNVPGSVSGGVLNGKAIALPKPVYPATARAAHASGPVQVQVVIDEDGNIIEAAAISGHLLLRAASVMAARGAKFYPTKLNGEPVKVVGIIIYNFMSGNTPPDESFSLESGPVGLSSSGADSATPPENGSDLGTRSGTDEPRPRVISGGVLNGRAIVFPKPDYPATAREAGASGAVEVQVTVDEEGKVISATAVSGHPLLQAAAVEAARGAKFSPTKLSGEAVKVTGTVVYNFVSGAEPKPTVINAGVLNGKAISLPKPAYPAEARDAHDSGTVEVQITIDEEGNVIEAEAIKGHKSLRAAAVDAARRAKFSPTKLSGVPVNVTGRIIYNFTMTDYPTNNLSPR
jgi:TonB family protein